MLGVIFLYAMVGTVIGASFGTGHWVVAIVLAGIAAYSCKYRFDKARNLRPSVMVCPNCGSSQIRIDNRIEGYSGTSNAQVQRSLVMPKYRKTVNWQYGSQYNRQRVGICQSCGFDYPYVTPQEAQQAQDRIKMSTTIGIIAAVFFALFGFAT